jgi:hypothetical protein
MLLLPQQQYGMGDLVKSLNKLPLFESVQFIAVPLYQRNALLLYHNLMKKKLVRSILMVDTQIDKFLASRMVSVLKDNPSCDNLEFICLFDHDGPNTSREEWQEDIDLQLAEMAC